MTNKPAQEIRMGRLKACIWPNVTDGVTRYSVTLSRLYKEGSDWKTSDSFGRDDLLLLGKVMDIAHTWIFNKENDRGSERAERQEETPL